VDRLPILGDLLIDLPPVIFHSVTKSRARLRLKGLYWPALDMENGTPGGGLVLIRTNVGVPCSRTGCRF
jgi:hypothetical protein